MIGTAEENARKVVLFGAIPRYTDRSSVESLRDETGLPGLAERHSPVPISNGGAYSHSVI